MENKVETGFTRELGYLPLVSRERTNGQKVEVVVGTI